MWRTNSVDVEEAAVGYDLRPASAKSTRLTPGPARNRQRCSTSNVRPSWSTSLEHGCPTGTCSVHSVRPPGSLRCALTTARRCIAVVAVAVLVVVERAQPPPPLARADRYRGTGADDRALRRNSAPVSSFRVPATGGNGQLDSGDRLAPELSVLHRFGERHDHQRQAPEHSDDLVGHDPDVGADVLPVGVEPSCGAPAALIVSTVSNVSLMCRSHDVVGLSRRMLRCTAMGSAVAAHTTQTPIVTPSCRGIPASIVALRPISTPVSRSASIHANSVPKTVARPGYFPRPVGQRQRCRRQDGDLDPHPLRSQSRRWLLLALRRPVDASALRCRASVLCAHFFARIGPSVGVHTLPSLAYMPFRPSRREKSTT